MNGYRSQVGEVSIPRSARWLHGLRNLLFLGLLPGTGIRRWLLLGAVGGLIFALGVAYMVRYYSAVGLPDFLPGPVEGFFFLILAVCAVSASSLKLTDMILSARAASLPDESLRDSMLRLREQARAPRLVAIGGGTGLASLLRGLKSLAQMTAIVTVGDDGGSSGRLRQELGVLPPGDIRNCIVALADAEPLMKDLFQHRFEAGTTLEGHSFGNLFIAALTAVTGSFEDAVNESGRILNVRGRIVPATLDNVMLYARLDSGETVRGESNIPHAGQRIEQLGIDPHHPTPYCAALESIQDAQLILIGPGSLYTSIMPNLLIPGMADAINAAEGPVVYVCNVASQPGETEGFDVAAHVRAIQTHCPGLRIDYVVANSNMTTLEPGNPAHLIQLGTFDSPETKLVLTDLMNPEFRTHHDPDKLAAAVMEIYHGETRNNGYMRRIMNRSASARSEERVLESSR